MNGSDAHCANANGDVALYDTTNSSYGNAVETPPQSDGQLATIAASTAACTRARPRSPSAPSRGGRRRPDDGHQPRHHRETRRPTPAQPVPWDTTTTSRTTTPTARTTAPRPSRPNGVVYVEERHVRLGNPADGDRRQPVRRLHGQLGHQPDVRPAPARWPGKAVTLTATVTSSVSQIGSGATVAFSQTTSTTELRPHHDLDAPISGCASQANWSTPVAVGSNWQSTVTCTTTEATNGTGAFSAVYSGGTYVNTSQGNLGPDQHPDPRRHLRGQLADHGRRLHRLLLRRDRHARTPRATPSSTGTCRASSPSAPPTTWSIDGNITYQDCSGKWSPVRAASTDFCPYSVAGPNDSLGLIANQYVEVNHPVTNGTGGSVLAACSVPRAPCATRPPPAAHRRRPARSRAGHHHRRRHPRPHPVLRGQQLRRPVAARATLAVYGSVQQYARGPVGTFDSRRPRQRLRQALHVGPAARLPVAPQLPRAVDRVVGPDVGDRPTPASTRRRVSPAAGCRTTAPARPAADLQLLRQPVATGGLPGYPASPRPRPHQRYATASSGGVATVPGPRPRTTAVRPSPATRVIPSPHVHVRARA